MAGTDALLQEATEDNGTNEGSPFGSSMPLQDLPKLSVQGSMLRTNKRKLRGSVSEGLDSECTPRELIQQCSPTLKHQRPPCRGKENDGEPFVLARRSRRKKEAASGKDPHFRRPRPGQVERTFC